MTSPDVPAEQGRIRKELGALAAKWKAVSFAARAKVARTESRTATADALFPFQFEFSDTTPCKRVEPLPAKIYRALRGTVAPERQRLG